MEYICGYCGKAYSTVGERMVCERVCHKNKVQEEEKLKISKREEEMKKDLNEISILTKERNRIEARISDLAKVYDKKYGTLTCPEFSNWFRPFETFFRL